MANMKLASLAGLAPAGPGMKGRVLGLLRNQGRNWCPQVDMHHEPSPSQGDVQICCTLGAGGNDE